MPVPPSPVLKAAARWMDQLRHSDIRKARALLTSHRGFSDLTPSQYAAGLEWLESVGLLAGPNTADLDRPLEIALYTAAIADAFWLEDAALLVPSPIELPEEAERAADVLGISVQDAFATVREASGKIDLAERSRIGLGGELAVLEALRNETTAEVRHVASISDGYGFDISVDAASFTGHLEVKTTTRRGRLTVHLSRHEFETMRRDASWMLVAARVDDNLRLRSLATIPRQWVETAAPRDRHRSGQWESARLDIPLECLVEGLPTIPTSLRTSHRGALGGVAGWPG